MQISRHWRMKSYRYRLDETSLHLQDPESILNYIDQNFPCLDGQSTPIPNREQQHRIKVLITNFLNLIFQDIDIIYQHTSPYEPLSTKYGYLETDVLALNQISRELDCLVHLPAFDLLDFKDCAQFIDIVNGQLAEIARLTKTDAIDYVSNGHGWENHFVCSISETYPTITSKVELVVQLADEHSLNPAQVNSLIDTIELNKKNES